jgi:hypothetical protein
MNRHINSYKSAVAAWLSAAFVMVLPVAAAPVAQPVTQVALRSVFVLPTNPSEGRDPFFPTSIRPYEDAASKIPMVADLTSLVLKGISSSPEHRLVIINNHTFGVGDEGDVLTSHSRIHIRCIEIKDKTVVVESGGQRHELSYEQPKQ